MSRTQTIIKKFELFMDDTTELSTQEELALANKVYLKVCGNRPWEFTKKAFTGTQSTSVSYIALPSYFAYLTANNNHTELNNEAGRPVIFVGDDFSPVPVVSFSDRRQYRNSEAAYIDIANERLVFTKQPTKAKAVEFDCSAVPDKLTLDTAPTFPERFDDIIYHGMCVDDFIIQQSDKSKSYAAENQAKYDMYLDDMAYWNSQLIMI